MLSLEHLRSKSYSNKKHSFFHGEYFHDVYHALQLY